MSPKLPAGSNPATASPDRAQLHWPRAVSCIVGPNPESRKFRAIWSFSVGEISGRVGAFGRQLTNYAMRTSSRDSRAPGRGRESSSSCDVAGWAWTNQSPQPTPGYRPGFMLTHTVRRARAQRSARMRTLLARASCALVILASGAGCEPVLNQKSAERLIPNGMNEAQVNRLLGTNGIISTGWHGEKFIHYFFAFVEQPPGIKNELVALTIVISNGVVIERQFP